VVIKLEQYDYAGAAAVGLVMVLISFGALLALNAVQFAFTARIKAQ
jgi:sulfate transport system permease protein